MITSDGSRTGTELSRRNKRVLFLNIAQGGMLMSEKTKTVSDYVGRIGTFITTNNYFYRGPLKAIIGSPPTHYRILDYKTGVEMDLLIMSVLQIKWEGERGI